MRFGEEDVALVVPECFVNRSGVAREVLADAHQRQIVPLQGAVLDRRVAEYAMRIPAEMHLKQRRLKYVTRKLGERYLSNELLYREKQGFSFPIALWLRGELKSLLQQVIDDSHLVEAGVLRREEMQRLHDEHCTGGIDHNFRLWILFQLELFQRHAIEGASVEELEAWVAAGRAG